MSDMKTKSSVSAELSTPLPFPLGIVIVFFMLSLPFSFQHFAYIHFAEINVAARLEKNAKRAVVKHNERVVAHAASFFRIDVPFSAIPHDAIAIWSLKRRVSPKMKSKVRAVRRTGRHGEACNIPTFAISGNTHPDTCSLHPA